LRACWRGLQSCSYTLSLGCEIYYPLPLIFNLLHPPAGSPPSGGSTPQIAGVRRNRKKMQPFSRTPTSSFGEPVSGLASFILFIFPIITTASPSPWYAKRSRRPRKNAVRPRELDYLCLCGSHTVAVGQRFSSSQQLGHGICFSRLTSLLPSGLGKGCLITTINQQTSSSSSSSDPSLGKSLVGLWQPLSPSCHLHGCTVPSWGQICKYKHGLGNNINHNNDVFLVGDRYQNPYENSDYQYGYGDHSLSRKRGSDYGSSSSYDHNDVEGRKDDRRHLNSNLLWIPQPTKTKWPWPHRNIDTYSLQEVGDSLPTNNADNSSLHHLTNRYPCFIGYSSSSCGVTTESIQVALSSSDKPLLSLDRNDEQDSTTTTLHFSSSPYLLILNFEPNRFHEASAEACASYEPTIENGVVRLSLRKQKQGVFWEKLDLVGRMVPLKQEKSTSTSNWLKEVTAETFMSES
jgi:hypothetical protein